MNTIRQEYLIDRDKEYALIQKLCAAIHGQYPQLNASNTLVVMVSPDYSATVAMHVAHALSHEGEMADIVPIHVPYPDQNVSFFRDMASRELTHFVNMSGCLYEHVLLVEAAVIRGTNYEWLTQLIAEKMSVAVVTACLMENTGSSYKSNVVAEYYNDLEQDVTFYYERFNKHWQ